MVVVCRDYEQKEWCGLEWDAIFDLLKKRKNDDVMLCRFDNAKVKGLYSTAGFVDLDRKTPELTATLILERLALNEGKPKNYYHLKRRDRSNAVKHPMNADSTRSRRFDIALSFTGDHRDVVEQLASRLAERLGRDRVLYDKYHDAEFARLDLDVYLPGLYRTQSELVVIFLCPEYGKKRWCNLEWRHIRQLIATADAGRIMLLSIGEPGDLSDLGIVRGDGYIEISHLAPEAVADKILTRLYLNQGIAPPANPPGADANSAGKAETRPTPGTGDGPKPALPVDLTTHSQPAGEPGTFWGWVESNSDLLTVGIAALAIAIIALTALRTKATGLALSACSIAAAGGWGAYRLSSRRRITKALLDLADRNEIDRPGYFRVRPYDGSEEDQRLFDRPDGEHLVILRWLRQSDQPVLFLSGTSGTGKSSLLYAYVLPRLRGDSVGPPARQPDAGAGGQPPPKIQNVVLRNYDNPLALVAAEVQKNSGF